MRPAKRPNWDLVRYIFLSFLNICSVSDDYARWFTYESPAVLISSATIILFKGKLLRHTISSPTSLQRNLNTKISLFGNVHLIQGGLEIYSNRGDKLGKLARAIYHLSKNRIKIARFTVKKPLRPKFYNNGMDLLSFISS